MTNKFNKNLEAFQTIITNKDLTKTKYSQHYFNTLPDWMQENKQGQMDKFVWLQGKRRYLPKMIKQGEITQHKGTIEDVYRQSIKTIRASKKYAKKEATDLEVEKDFSRQTRLTDNAKKTLLYLANCEVVWRLGIKMHKGHYQGAYYTQDISMSSLVDVMQYGAPHWKESSGRPFIDDFFANLELTFPAQRDLNTLPLQVIVKNIEDEINNAWVKNRKNMHNYEPLTAHYLKYQRPNQTKPPLLLGEQMYRNILWRVRSKSAA